MTNVNHAGEYGRTAPKMTDIPVTPPNEKLFGNLNTYTPTTRTSVARVSIRYSSTVCPILLFTSITFIPILIFPSKNNFVVLTVLLL